MSMLIRNRSPLMNDYIVSVKDTAHQKMTLCFLSALHYNEYVRAALIVCLDAQQGMIYMYIQGGHSIGRKIHVQRLYRG